MVVNNYASVVGFRVLKVHDIANNNLIDHPNEESFFLLILIIKCFILIYIPQFFIFSSFLIKSFIFYLHASMVIHTFSNFADIPNCNVNIQEGSVFTTGNCIIPLIMRF